MTGTFYTYHSESPPILAVYLSFIPFKDGNFKTKYYKGENELGDV